MMSIRESLKASKGVCEVQEIDLQRVKTSQQELENENRVLRKENRLLQKESKRLSRENKEF
jgi:hypothetical protein